MDDNKIWFTSDYHFGHQKYFIYGPRGFSSNEDMSEYIIRAHNERVSWSDDVYFLGDAMLNDNKYGINCFRRLNGKFHIIIGNHDSAERIELLKALPNVVEICGYATALKCKGYHLYLSHYPTLVGNYDEDKPLKRRVLNIHGHTHSKDKFMDCTCYVNYNAAVDAHNCAPVELEEIIKDICKKKEAK